MWEYKEIIINVGLMIDAIGVGIIAVGTIAAFWLYIQKVALRAGHEQVYQRARYRLARAIIFGLEILIAGDIIRTVALTPTFENIGVLALIVIVRTFLAFTLQVEIEGAWPWSQGNSASRVKKTGLP